MRAILSLMSLTALTLLSSLAFSSEMNHEIKSPERSKHFFELSHSDFNFKATGLKSGSNLPKLSGDLRHEFAIFEKNDSKIANLGNAQLKRHLDNSVRMSHFLTFSHFRYCNEVV